MKGIWIKVNYEEGSISKGCDNCGRKSNKCRISTKGGGLACWCPVGSARAYNEKECTDEHT